jgi:hypothetical protein
VNEKNDLPIRPHTLHVRRDLEEMPASGVLSRLFDAPASRHFARLYADGSLSCTVEPVALYPRNGVEMWPARLVRLSCGRPKIEAAALGSICERGRPIVSYVTGSKLAQSKPRT